MFRSGDSMTNEIQNLKFCPIRYSPNVDLKFTLIKEKMSFKNSGI